MARSTWRRRAGALAAVLVLGASACGDDAETTVTAEPAAPADGDDGGDGGDGGGTIALLLPETKTARYETQDRPLFEAKVAELCADCEVLYSNADQDAEEQLSQAEAALTNGAEVLVLDPVDGEAAGAIVDLAVDAGVPVISYDRLVLNADVDLYISFDNEKVGELQADALIGALEEDGITEGDLVMINGSPTDNNATLFKQGAHSVIDETDFDVAAESDTVEWSPDNAQKDMDGHITSVGPDEIVGVYAANDGTAGGAIAAMKAAGIDPLPPVTGQDAELAAIQRVLDGEQYMTVYKAIKLEAEAAAGAAVELLRGEEPTGADDTVDNGSIEVPSILLDPVAVTADNVADTVIADGFWSVEDVCAGDYADACDAAGIS